VKYRNERMFGVADVHADTKETYRLVGSGLATLAREAKEKTAKAAKSTKENLDMTIDKARNRPFSAPAAAPATPTSTARASPATGPNSFSSPVRSPSLQDARSKESMASAAKEAEKRGHSTFAKLLQSRTSPGAAGGAPPSSPPIASKVPQPVFSAPLPGEFDRSDEEGSEETDLTI
jgi:hypothetical protein